MALSNLENRVKQDSAYPRTAEDAIRRDKDLDKVTIKANQIELEGYTTINGGFKIDKEGNMECNNAVITGGKITMESDVDNPALVIKRKNLNLRTQFAGDGVSITDNGTTEGNVIVYDPKITLHYSDFGYGYLSIRGNDSYITLGDTAPNQNWLLSMDVFEGGSIYLADLSGTETITLKAKTGNIKCVSLTQTSLAERKKNFEKLENALDLIKDIDIYKYNMKTDNDGDKKHIGFVIGDNYKYREELTDIDNKGVDLYSFISVCCKAIQEQQKEIEELRKLVNK